MAATTTRRRRRRGWSLEPKRTIKGPAVFLAQFAADAAPYNSLPSLAKWAADMGCYGVQIPTWDTRLIDMKQAAESDAYCDELKDGRPRQSLRSPNVGGGAASFRRPRLEAARHRPPRHVPAFLRWTPILNNFDAHGVDVCYEKGSFQWFQEQPNELIYAPREGACRRSSAAPMNSRKMPGRAYERRRATRKANSRRLRTSMRALPRPSTPSNRSRARRHRPQHPACL